MSLTSWTVDERVAFAELPREQRAESLARRHGYGGPWRVRTATITTPADFQAVLEHFEAGERRAGFAFHLSKALIAFFGQLQPEDFRRFARTLVAIVHDKKNTTRTRLRAVEAAVRPLLDAVKLMRDLRKRDTTLMLDHLEGLVRAFFEELGTSEYRRFHAALMEMAERGAALTRVRAIRIAMKITTELARALATLEEDRAFPLSLEPSESPQAASMRAAMAKIEAECAAAVAQRAE